MAWQTYPNRTIWKRRQPDKSEEMFEELGDHYIETPHCENFVAVEILRTGKNMVPPGMYPVLLAHATRVGETDDQDTYITTFQHSPVV